mmetsp:Transcript_24852/g.34704  ORF Transcript_24852/g.34704 Transcript_24852/m.34704 type:complete len:84 (+) Transcript_24852:649-900(+)
MIIVHEDLIPFLHDIQPDLPLEQLSVWPLSTQSIPDSNSKRQLLVSYQHSKNFRQPSIDLERSCIANYNPHVEVGAQALNQHT